MERTEKQEAVGALKTELAKATSLVLADFRGLTVKVDTGVRREFRLNGCRYQVVKNTLLGLAVKGTPMEGIESLLAGPTAIAYSFEDPAAPAKVAAKIAKAEEKFVIKGGYVDGRALDVKGIEALSTLPGKDELRAMFLATLLAVPQNFVRLLNAAPQNFVYLLASREDALKEGQSQ
ncbi:MAG: 50S ribosomal protein L10 [Verrucomicrobiota bacterium]